MPGADPSSRRWRQRCRQGAFNLFLLAAALAFVIGVWSPMMTLTRLVVIESTFSVLTGIRHLYLESEYLLFAILGLFTVILPVVKLAVLAYAWNRPRSAHRRTLRWMEALGKWSMLDVFVVAVLIASVRLGPLASIELHRGLYFFSASVIMIMIASRVVYLRVRNAAADPPAAMPPSSC